MALPQAKILSNILSGTTPLSMCQRPALQQDCWMTPFHEWPQTIKRLNPVYTEDWMELITSSSASPGPTILPSHQQNVTHTWTLLLFLHPNTSQDQTSWEVTCFSWWMKISFIDFMKLMITILFTNKDKYLKCLLLKTKHTIATHTHTHTHTHTKLLWLD